MALLDPNPDQDPYIVKEGSGSRNRMYGSTPLPLTYRMNSRSNKQKIISACIGNQVRTFVSRFSPSQKKNMDADPLGKIITDQGGSRPATTPSRFESPFSFPNLQTKRINEIILIITFKMSNWKTQGNRF